MDSYGFGKAFGDSGRMQYHAERAAKLDAGYAGWLDGGWMVAIFGFIWIYLDLYGCVYMHIYGFILIYLDLRGFI